MRIACADRSLRSCISISTQNKGKNNKGGSADSRPFIMRYSYISGATSFMIKPFSFMNVFSFVMLSWVTVRHCASVF